MDNQEPSSSSSEQEQEMDKVEDKQKEKKLKEELKSDDENQIEMEVEGRSFIDELPPEMLMQIFKFLNVTSLVNCRLVSRKWNGLARQIIQSSDNVETVFMLEKYWTFGNLTFKGVFKPTATLENFINYFEDSKESPLYTRFRFANMKISVFDHADWIKFISDFGKNVKSFKVQVLVYNFDDFMELVEKLRNLLLNQLPNLQEFGLILPAVAQPNVTPHPREVQLFPTTTPTSNEETARAAIRLPHLKILYLCEHSFSDYTGIVTDLLRAAINLQKIEFFVGDNSRGVIKSCHFLHSLGKLYCLQTAFINFDIELLSKLKENPSFPLAFKLKKLTLFVQDSVNEDKNCWSSAAVFLSRLFESSKDTLRELDIGPAGFLSALKLPKFPKLTRLDILKGGEERDVDEIKVQDLLSGLEFNQVFPLLQDLELQVPWTAFFPHAENQNDSCIPTLKFLRITGDGMTEEDIARISLVCPNLKGVQIGQVGRKIKNFPEVGNAIWTRLTKLESLELEIDLNSPAISFPAIDSCFTGFSGEDVIRLYEELTQVEESAKSQGSQSKSELKNQLEAETKNPSILDLKDLKELTVSFHSYGRRRPEKMLIVSEKCAFQLMENLKYKINN